MAEVTYTCPVCGFPSLTREPRSIEGGGSYEWCPSCGFEFGFTDDDSGFTYAGWRELWIANGMLWASESFLARPRDWNPVEQLKRLLNADPS
jgi:hypothetical protein